MRTTAKDVILLCKGWYNKEQYPTILDALKQYYRKNYCNDLEDQLNESFLLKTVLIEAMREIGTHYPDRLLYFINGFLMYGETLHGIPDINNTDYNYQLFYRIVNYLSKLQMRGDRLVEIDTNSYFYETRNGQKRLVENII